MRLHSSSAVGLSLVAGILFCSMNAAPLAAQTTSPTVITSCVSRLTGVTRIVAAPSACNANVENVVQWNQQGPASAPGPAGAQGAAGRAGPVGATGAPGAAGPTGHKAQPDLREPQEPCPLQASSPR